MKTFLLLLVLLSSLLLNNTSFSQWVQVASPEGGGITDMLVTQNGNLIVTCASFNFPTGKGGIRYSTNSGATWINNMQIYTARTLAHGQNGWVWASAWNYPTTAEGLYVSTNQGATWDNYRYLIGASNNIFAIEAMDNNQTIYIGTRNGVMKSTNGGYNFFLANTGMPGNTWVRDLAVTEGGTVLFAATTTGLYKSYNGALSWTIIPGVASGDTVKSVRTIRRNTEANDDLVVTTSNGKAYKDDTGFYSVVVIAALFDANMDVGIASGPAENFLLYCLYPKVGTGEGGVAKSTGGGNPILINDGFPNPAPVTAIATSGNNSDFFAGTFFNQSDGAKIYKRTSSSVGVNYVSSELPDGFALSQNYPNPFNPITKIKFSVPKNSMVNLVIYDALGKEVQTILNKQLSAGVYEANWDAGKFNSGVYFYTLTSEGFTETKKMLLVK